MKHIIDLHSHTVACNHAYSTLHENVVAAYEKGLQCFGYSEHGPGDPNGADPKFFTNFKVLPRTYKDMQLLFGCEANIVDENGGLDMDNKLLATMDYVIASMHMLSAPKCDKEGYTKTVIAAMQNPYVNIIGHPDDSRMPLDYEQIVKAAKEYNVLLEVNNSSLHPKSFREGTRGNMFTYLELCKQYEVSIIMGSDSHYCTQVGDFTYALEVLDAVNFPKELIVNDDIEKLRRFINI